MDFPGVTQQPIIHVDETPDEEYPLRILRVYRENCNCMWATDPWGGVDDPALELMNEHNRQRAEILDRAIAKLAAK